MPTFDPQVQSENIAFDIDAMIECSSCGRMNPPNRLKCIYCAGKLMLAVDNAANIKPALRKLELWESGFNLVIREKIPQPELASIARYLSMDDDVVAAILAADAVGTLTNRVGS